MAEVLLSTLADALGGPVVADATFTATATRARAVGDGVVANKTITVPVVHGVPSEPILLDQSGVDWCWRLRVVFPSIGVRIDRTVAVPDVPSVEWADLVDVDPATLLPSEGAVPAWTAAVGQVAAALADTETARDGAVTAQGLSEAARDASVLARGIAEIARDGAVVAQGASEDARDQAQVYAANTVALQDTTFTALIADPESATRTQLNATFVASPSPNQPLLPTVGQMWFSSSFKHVRPPVSLSQRRVVFKQTGWEGAALQEASVWVHDGVFKSLFSAGHGLGFASCNTAADPTVASNWARPDVYTGPVVSGAKHSSIYIEDGTIHLYYIDIATSTKLMHATASLADSVPIFGSATQVMTLPPGSSVFGNMRVVLDGSTYRMMIEHKVAETGRWQQGWATAAAPSSTWTLGVNTIQTLWPEANRQGSGGAWLVKENGEWVLWYHASVNWNGLLPSDIYRAAAPNLGADNFVLTDNKLPVIRRRAAHEVDQVADVELIRAPDGTVYAFWTGMHNRGAAFAGAISCAAMLPTMMTWDGNDWVQADSPADPGAAITDVVKPRTAMVSANFTTAYTDGTTWEDIPGASVTAYLSGPDVEVEFRTACAAGSSDGYKYEFRVLRAGSDSKPLGSMAGNAGNMSSFVGVAKYTQLTPGSYFGFKVQVKVPSGAAAWNCRPVTFPEREYAALKVTDVAYP